MSRLTHKQTEKRDLMLISLLAHNPQLTHDQAIKASKEKYGCGIAFDRFKELKTAALKGPPVEQVKEDAVKKDLKKGTKPLKAKIKEMGKALVESGVDKAVMTVVDGVPTWRITERRTYDV